MSSISESVIDSLVQNLVRSLGQSYGLTLGPTNTTGTTSQSLLLRTLGVGTNSDKFIYRTIDFKRLLSDYPDFKSEIVKMLRKRKCPYTLNELLRTSVNVIVQCNKTASKASILFVGYRRLLLYSLIIIGFEYSRCRDELIVFSTGEADL